MTKMTRDQARAYHPSVWMPDDLDEAAAQAQAIVESGKRRLRVVGETERGLPMLLLTRSRERKARAMDAIGVGLLMLFAALFGVVLMLASAPHVKAAPISDDVLDYTVENGQIACEVLDDYPSVAGLTGVMQAVVEDGFTSRQAGEIVALSIYEYCPNHADLIDKFIALYATSEVA